MRISATEEYGLRCILQLARVPEKTQVPASQIAQCEGISVQYASKMMHLLRKAGLVTAERGLHGGFRLAKSPDQITLAEVLQALGNDREEKDFCKKFSGERNECVHMADCSVRPVWAVLLSYFDSMLDGLTLGDLLSHERQTRVVIERKAKVVVEKESQRPFLMKRVAEASRGYDAK